MPGWDLLTWLSCACCVPFLSPYRSLQKKSWGWNRKGASVFEPIYGGGSALRWKITGPSHGTAFDPGCSACELWAWRESGASWLLGFLKIVPQDRELKDYGRISSCSVVLPRVGIRWNRCGLCILCSAQYSALLSVFRPHRALEATLRMFQCYRNGSHRWVSLREPYNSIT